MNLQTLSEQQKTGSKGISAEISEIFSSLQGEGIYVGEKQIFIRFGRCNMSCVWCDEADKMKEDAFTPYSLDRLMSEVLSLESQKGPHSFVSLTGGEPLFYVDFLSDAIVSLRRSGFKIYLETNGVLPKALLKLIEGVDIVSMDFKLPSSTLDPPFWEEHEAFLKIAQKKEVFVKVVVTAETLEEELIRAVELIRSTNPAIPLILQPVSTEKGPDPEALFVIQKRFYPLAAPKLKKVLIIPQMHKIWGVK